MGFDKFIWKTISDGRERELHKQLNNTTWSYDNPPVIDERTGQTGLPGETYNCRCEAIPFSSDSMIGIKDRINEKNSKNKISAYLTKLAKNSSDDVEWITVKGNHIPIKPGQTKEEAVKEFLSKKTQSKKSKETIAIAGVKKGKPMSFKKADGGRVNLNYNKGAGYQNNCQTCVAVFEARLRGYDIEAVPYDESNEEMKTLAKNPALAYINPETGESPEFNYSKARNAKECEDWLKKNIKRNQRYIFAFQPHYGSGHVIQVNKKLDGSLHFYDPQNGQSYGEDYLKTSVKYQLNFRNVIIGKSPQIARVDDTELNVERLEKIFKQNHK